MLTTTELLLYNFLEKKISLDSAALKILTEEIFFSSQNKFVHKATHNF